MPETTYLLLGHKGFIGGLVYDYLLSLSNIVVVCSDTRLDNVSEMEDLLEELKPDRVLCCVGRTHGKDCATIDYLEDKLTINMRDNLFSPISLAQLCCKYNIHMTYIGTGCIFEYENFENLEPEFTEESLPNFFGSSYSVVKGYTDRIFHQYPFNSHVLNLRIRMPIVGFDNPRNFITKIVGYEKVINIPNAMTVLDDMIPHMISMADRKITGTINCVNPGVISHVEILKMYKDIVNKDFTWQTFSVEEQDQILKSKRSNNALCTNEIQKLCPGILPIKSAVRVALGRMSSK